MNAPYDFGPGKLYFRARNAAEYAPWQPFGDLAALSLSVASAQAGRTENWSGNRGRLPGQPMVGALALTGLLQSLTPASLALLVSGSVDEQPAGYEPDYVLPAVAAGSVERLPHLAVQGLVITDSGAPPVTLSTQHYALDGEFGILAFTDQVAGLTQPLHVAFGYAASHEVGLLTRAPELLSLRYEGINFAADNAPFVLELYQVELARLKDLALVSAGQGLTSVPLAGEVCWDAARAAPGQLGGFGRLVQAVMA